MRTVADARTEHAILRMEDFVKTINRLPLEQIEPMWKHAKAMANDPAVESWERTTWASLATLLNKHRRAF